MRDIQIIIHEFDNYSINDYENNKVKRNINIFLKSNQI